MTSLTTLKDSLSNFMEVINPSLGKIKNDAFVDEMGGNDNFFHIFLLTFHEQFTDVEKAAEFVNEAVSDDAPNSVDELVSFIQGMGGQNKDGKTRWTNGMAFFNKIGGAENTANFITNIGGTEAADFVELAGGADNAGTFVNGVGIAEAMVFINDVGLSCASGFVAGNTNNAVNYLVKIKEERDNGIKVAERNVEGYAIENEDLTGKNLSGLKITRLEGCGYDSSNPPNFSRCDLTECDMTNLISRN